MIAVIDYSVGNIGSIANMLSKIGAEFVVTSDHEEIQSAHKILLPGVGAFDEGVKRLNSTGLFELLNKLVLDEGRPVLGICLGMQLLTRGSEEGELQGFGWVPADTIRFKFPDSENEPLNIPHMGWNKVKPTTGQGLYSGFDEELRFYFVHSYHVVCDNESDVSAKAFYGFDFHASIQKGHIYGAQFHPEKSHRFGMLLLKNFVEL